MSFLVMLLETLRLMNNVKKRFLNKLKIFLFHEHFTQIKDCLLKI